MTEKKAKKTAVVELLTEKDLIGMKLINVTKLTRGGRHYVTLTFMNRAKRYRMTVANEAPLETAVKQIKT